MAMIILCLLFLQLRLIVELIGVAIIRKSILTNTYIVKSNNGSKES
jgi:hypothetical protein